DGAGRPDPVRGRPSPPAHEAPAERADAATAHGDRDRGPPLRAGPGLDVSPDGRQPSSDSEPDSLSVPAAAPSPSAASAAPSASPSAASAAASASSAFSASTSAWSRDGRTFATTSSGSVSRVTSPGIARSETLTTASKSTRPSIAYSIDWGRGFGRALTRNDSRWWT